MRPEPLLMSPPPSLPTSASLFLDFDGTLVPLAPRPQDVVVAAWVVPTLQSLAQKLGGALAIVSGRPMAAIDAFLHPLVLAGAGCHGAEQRNAGGRVQRRDADLPLPVVHRAHALAARHPGLLVENKPSGLALHFRLNPGLATLCRDQLAQALVEIPNTTMTWELILGHGVCELKQRAVSKGTAVSALIAGAPFAGRRPVFIGDDVTDEDGIRAAQAAGGIGIRVGPGDSLAQHRLRDTDAVAAWLMQVAAVPAYPPTAGARQSGRSAA
jgi:trehalose 6-phosphate phosphatase